MPGLVFPTTKEQLELLEGVLRQNESKADVISEERHHHSSFAGGKRWMLQHVCPWKRRS